MNAILIMNIAPKGKGRKTFVIYISAIRVTLDRDRQREAFCLKMLTVANFV
jgi:hypothetical protein